MDRYRLYIDYGNGYRNEKENTLPSIIKKLDNSEYDKYLIIKEENNQDIPMSFGYEREYLELIERNKIKVKK